MGEILSGVLIAGSSHVGKTTLAKRLSEALGCTMISTDALARHPGRPWPEVRLPVAEYYERLSPETIYWFLRVHHENMWPGLKRAIEDGIAAGRRFVLEGSALRPEFVAPLISGRVVGLCLHADSDVLRERMRTEAGYQEAGEAGRSLIDKFIERSLRDNSEMYRAAQENGMRIIDAAEPRALADIVDELVRRASSQTSAKSGAEDR